PRSEAAQVIAHRGLPLLAFDLAAHLAAQPPARVHHRARFVPESVHVKYAGRVRAAARGRGAEGGGCWLIRFPVRLGLGGEPGEHLVGELGGDQGGEGGGGRGGGRQRGRRGRGA